MSAEEGMSSGDLEAAEHMRKMGVELPGEEKGGGPNVPWNKVEKKKELTRAEKEMIFIVKNIADRLTHLHPEARYEITKGICGTCSFLGLVLGGVFVLKGTATTVIFASDDFNMDFVIAGAVMATPCVIWFIYIFIMPYFPCGPCRRIRERRTGILEQRHERNQPSMFNNMVASANEHSKPPIIRTPLFAMFRKKEYKIVCHTMEEFQEIFYFKTGVPPDRQLLKLREPDDSSNVFEFKPEEFILDLDARGVRKNTMFWIYTKGGFENDVSAGPQHRMEVARVDGKGVKTLFTEVVKRYERDVHKKDDVDAELDSMLNSSPVSKGPGGMISSGGMFGDSFSPQGGDGESGEDRSPKFKVTKKKRGKKKVGQQMSVYADLAALEEPDVDDDFLADIEKAREARMAALSKYPDMSNTNNKIDAL
jgi:hypothetical protein